MLEVFFTERDGLNDKLFIGDFFSNICVEKKAFLPLVLLVCESVVCRFVIVVFINSSFVIGLNSVASSPITKRNLILCLRLKGYFVIKVVFNTFSLVDHI